MSVCIVTGFISNLNNNTHGLERPALDSYQEWGERLLRVPCEKIAFLDDTITQADRAQRRRQHLAVGLVVQRRHAGGNVAAGQRIDPRGPAD